MEEDSIEKYLEENKECYDRFTFDNIFRSLLSNDFSHEEALDTILCNCSLSAIIFQQRIDNNYYEDITVEEDFSQDLLQEIEAERIRIVKEQLKRCLN